MTKAELIAKICEKAGITKADAERGLGALLDAIEGVLVQGEKIAISGFGSFSVADRKERIGRNPKTGKEIKIPATKAVEFSVGQALKDAVQ